jgi:threonyl-tRNA synthetase
MDLGDRKMSEEDLAALEKKMNELAKQNNPYSRKEISKNEAVKYFTEKGDQYKLDLLTGLNDGEITFYSQGNFHRSLPGSAYTFYRNDQSNQTDHIAGA